MAARYWRAVGLETWGGANLELSEFQLLGASGRVDTGAIVTCTVPPDDGTLADINDDDTTTLAVWSRAHYSVSGFALVFDFGVPTAVTAPKVGYGTERRYSLNAVTLQYSADGREWETKGMYGALAFTAPLSFCALLVSDPHHAKLQLHLHLDGDYVDVSSAARSVSSVGAGVSFNANGRFGSCAGFSGGTSGYVSCPDHASLRPGTGDFTLEAQCFFNAIGAYYGVLGKRLGGGGAGLHWSFAPYADGGAGGTMGLRVAYGATEHNPSATRGGSITVGVWHHVAWSRISGVSRIFINGRKMSEWADTRDLNSTADINIGDTGNGQLNGRIDEVKLYIGVGLYEADFVPPALANEDELAPVLSADVIRPKLGGATNRFAKGDDGGFDGARPMPGMQVFRDVEASGTGRIAGTVKIDADPADVPVHRKVRLHRDIDGMKVRETWSDPITGAYEFLNVDPSYQYTVISYDHTHSYRAVIADNLTPETIP